GCNAILERSPCPLPELIHAADAAEHASALIWARADSSTPDEAGQCTEPCNLQSKTRLSLSFDNTDRYGRNPEHRGRGAVEQPMGKHGQQRARQKRSGTGPQVAPGREPRQRRHAIATG